MHLLEKHFTQHRDILQHRYVNPGNAADKRRRPLLIEENLTQINGDARRQQVQSGTGNGLIGIQINARIGMQQ